MNSVKLANIGVEEARSILPADWQQGASTLKHLADGDWSRAFSLALDGSEYVLRVGLHLDDFMRDMLVSDMTCRDIPIPRVYEVGTVDDLAYCITDRVFGSFLEQLPAEDLRTALPSLFGVLDGLRKEQFPDVTGFGGMKPDGNGEYPTWRSYLLDVDSENERIQGWRSFLSQDEDVYDIYKKGPAFLRDHVQSCPEIGCLLHTDLMHENVFVQEGAITGLIDWGCALWGDFVYELAAFTFYAPWFSNTAAIDWKGEALSHYQSIGLEVPSFEDRLKVYEVHIGLKGMIYCAFVKDAQELRRHADRVSQTTLRRH